MAPGLEKVARDSLLVPRDAWIKAAVFALLILNTGIYLASGTTSEALDSIAWLTLLALFELETGKLGRTHFPGQHSQENVCVPIFLVHAIRIVCVAAIGIAAAGFVYNGEWLDAVNSALWIAVVVLLEVEVRRPAAVAAQRARLTAAAATLYAGLVAVALVWLWRGEWFDAYDAALWLVGFATIEMNVLRAGEAG